MKRQDLIILLNNDGYKKTTIDSILTGRRKPNAEKRYEYEKKHNIPFTAWRNIKSYSQENDTPKKNNVQGNL